VVDNKPEFILLAAVVKLGQLCSFYIASVHSDAADEVDRSFSGLVDRTQCYVSK